MAYKFSFEKLNVWMDSKELVKRIYLVTKDFPNYNEDSYQIIRKEIEKIPNKPNALRSIQLNN